MSVIKTVCRLATVIALVGASGCAREPVEGAFQPRVTGTVRIIDTGEEIKAADCNGLYRVVHLGNEWQFMFNLDCPITQRSETWTSRADLVQVFFAASDRDFIKATEPRGTRLIDDAAGAEVRSLGEKGFDRASNRGTIANCSNPQSNPTLLKSDGPMGSFDLLQVDVDESCVIANLKIRR